MTTEVSVETDETPDPSPEPVIVAPTVVTTPAEDSGPSEDLAMTVGALAATVGALVERIDRIEQTAASAEVTAEIAAELAVEAVEEAAEPEPVVIEEVEEDEPPVKEPWTHRHFGFGSKE